MALVKCPECGRDISTAAAACPGCGAPAGGRSPPKKTRTPDRIGTAILLLGGTVLALVTCSSLLGGAGRRTAEVTPGQAARGACSLFITRAADDPGSVEWFSGFSCGSLHVDL